MQPIMPTSEGQDDNFFSVSSSAATYSVDASFNEYIYIYSNSDNTQMVQDSKRSQIYISK